VKFFEKKPSPKIRLPAQISSGKICLFEQISVYYNMDNDTFWGRVRPLIKAHKMTHRQFAEYMRISQYTFTNWIRYKRIPDTGTAYEMAIALGVTLNYLLGGREAKIADWRMKELAARDAAAHILDLVNEIQKETSKLRPLIKKNEFGRK